MSRQAARAPFLPPLAVVLTAGLIIGGCAGHRVSETAKMQARSSYDAATESLNQGKLAQALTLLQQVNRLDPDVPTYHNALGVVYLQFGRPDMALPEFKRVIALDADYPEGHLNQGIALAEQGQWTEAVASYQRALKSPRLVSPDTAYQNLGLALYHLQRYDEAEQALRFAISLDEKMEGAYYHLGLVLLAEGRKNEARTAFERTRELAPNSPFGQAAVDRLKALANGG